MGSSIIGFWKYWHSSFNLWNIRYIYIPMGGHCKGTHSEYQHIRKFRNIICVFAFTTLWHGDFELKLLIWGSLMALLIIPETLIKNYYYHTSNALIAKCRNNQRLNRYIHALGAVINILMLFIANLIGFGPGLEMVIQFLKIIVFKPICIATFGFIYFTIWCGVL